MVPRREPKEGRQARQTPLQGLPALAVSAAGRMLPGQEGIELDQRCPKFSDKKSCPGY